MEKIYFKNSNNNKLCGIISNPLNDLSKPMIVLCHEFSSSKDSSTFVTLESKFNEKSFSTFRFDFFAHGESE